MRKFERYFFLPIPSIRATAMSGAPVSFDRIIPEETQGPMPVEPPTTLASGSLDSFHHVEAVLKEDNVSTGTLDSQDWEMVTEMVEDTDNAATHFLQGKHVVDLEGPAPNLQDSIDKMIETVEKMKLGSTADGVEAPPGRRAWLPLRRPCLGMRHLWMTRWWSRPHTNGRFLAEVHPPLHSSWQMFPSSMRR